MDSPLERGRGVLEYINLVCITHPLPPLKRGDEESLDDKQGDMITPQLDLLQLDLLQLEPLPIPFPT